MDYQKLFDLTGKICVVTGGSGYLGTENVKILKDFGATVVNADRNMRETAADLFLECDIADTQSVKSVFAAVAQRYGKVDVLVNCAAFYAGHGKDSRIEDMSDEIWARGVEGSLNSTFRTLREVIPYMKEHGGSIINYCSMYGLVSPDLRIYGEGNPQVNPPNYGAAKAGVAQLTR